QNALHGGGTEGARESIGQLDGRLHDARVAEQPGYDEELEIEGEVLHGNQRKRVGEDLAAKELEPGLGIPDAKVEKDAGEQLIGQALQAAEQRVVHPRIGM